jgi:trigger factor
LKVTREKEEQSQVYLNIEMESEEIDAATEVAYRTLSKKYRIPGFRKGKAPRDLLEQYIGAESLLEEAVNEMAPDACDRAIKEQEITPIGPPQLEVKTIDPLVFSVVVPVPPTIDPGDYKSVRVPVPESNFKPEDVDRVIDDLRNQYSTFEPDDKAIESGDMSVIDVSSTIGDEDFISQDEAQYQVFQDSPAPLPGFARHLIGLKKGDVKEFKLTLPDDVGEDKAGKEADFKVTVKEVKRQIMPEVNDEFVGRIEQVEPKLTTVAELKERITSDLTARSEQEVKTSFREKVIDAIVAGAKVEFPPVMMESELQLMIDDQMRQYGLLDNKEQYFKMLGKTEEELREEGKPLAEKRVARALILGKIGTEEKVTAEEDEIKAEIEAYTAEAAENKAQYEEIFQRPENRARLAEMIVSRKTVELVEEIARGKPVAKKAKPAAAKDTKVEDAPAEESDSK